MTADFLDFILAFAEQVRTLCYSFFQMLNVPLLTLIRDSIPTNPVVDKFLEFFFQNGILGNTSLLDLIVGSIGFVCAFTLVKWLIDLVN